MYFLQIFLYAILAIVTLGYLWLKQKQFYWVKRNVPNEPATFYYIGRGKHIAYYLQDVYKRFINCGQPLIGIFMALTPAVLLLDLDLIKNVFIADFESFPDRGFYHNLHDDPLSGNIVRLEGDAWRRLRTKLTPTFTSAKMKFMFPTVVAVGDRFQQLLHEILQTKPNELEIRDLCARYTTDVIGSVAFGIECNSLRDPHTEFRLKGDKAFISFNPIIETLTVAHPKLARRLHIKAFPQELIDFYTKIVTENIEDRELNKIRRNDFLDILIELKNTKVDGDFVLTLQEIIGQAFVFFIGGFETSSSTMTYCLYELCQNEEIQQRARNDILQSLERHNNDLSYECLKDMRYLEQVFMETLRKYPVAPTLKRVTRKAYPVPNTNFIIEEGVQAIIPVYSIHHNPEYFPEPAKFDPERFSTTEIQNRHQMTYLPFGAGPRVCIAERFGKMQTLIGLAMLLRNFKFTATDKTPKILDFDIKNLRIFSLKSGIQMKVEAV